MCRSPKVKYGFSRFFKKSVFLRMDTEDTVNTVNAVNAHILQFGR